MGEQAKATGRSGTVTKRQFAHFRTIACASTLLMLCTTACREERESPPAPEPALPVAVEVKPVEPPDPCMELARSLQSTVQLPGTPELDKSRAEILARARSVPVVFLRPPAAPSELNEVFLRLREGLGDSERAAQAIQEILRKTRGNYEARRSIFLSEQYLYAEDPLVALRLSQILRLDHLYNEPELIIERGDETIRVSREDGRYWMPPEPSPDSAPKKHPHGKLASLLLFDRVRLPSEAWSARLHLDFGPQQKALGFESFEILAKTPEKWAVELDTRGVKSTAVFELGPKGELSLSCEATSGDKQALETARASALRDATLIAPVLESAREIIRRGLPFDEPRTEEGQQDGLLRIHFRQAYRRYRATYEFNGDSYYVFDGFGRPRLPQVCIDFITDAFDWGTGGYWPPRGEKRLRVKGALDFGSMGIENPRSVESLAEFATATPEWFDMIWFDKAARVKFRHREKFFAALKNDASRYRPGDVVFIYGLRDDGKFHYHSFMIDEKDPVTGMPTVVMANAGPPQARSWEGEMQNAPGRSIVARLRVRPEILELAQTQARKFPGVPLEPPRRLEDEDQDGLDLPQEATKEPADLAEAAQAAAFEPQSED